MLDFSKVEALRKYMLLTNGHMAALLGVSRVTYHGWVVGKPLRKSNRSAVIETLKKLLKIVKDYQWPTPEIHALSPEQRIQRLKDILKQL